MYFKGQVIQCNFALQVLLAEEGGKKCMMLKH